MATAALLPLPRAVFYDANGNPLAGGLVNTYVPGGTTPKTTWQDSGETTPNSNPIVLDADGSCLLYGSGNYQLTVTDALGNAIPAYSGLSADLSTAAGISPAMLPVVGAATLGIAMNDLSGLQYIPSIAALRSNSGTLPTTIWLTGYYAGKNWGSGPFALDANDTTTADNGGTVIVDAANNRWKRITFGLDYSVLDFGAKPDCTAFGTGTVNDTMFQACFDAATAAGVSIRIPAGSYRLTSQLTISLSGGTSLTSPPMPNITGAGARATFLLWDANASQTTGLSYTGTAANNLAAYSPVKISGFSLMKPDGNGYGLVPSNMLHLHVEDVICYQWNFGCVCTDVQESTFVNCLWAFNLHGFQAVRSTFTEPNNFTFLSCMCAGNQNWGYDLQGGGAVNFSGGSIESNGGVGSDSVQWGVRLFYSTSTPQESSAGATFTSVYFERNAGNGDIYFANSGFQSTLTVIGCTFNRADPMNTGKYGTNCVRVEISGGNQNTLVLQGNGFKGLGTYPPSSSRPYIGIVNPTQPLVINDSGNIYFSSVEAPLWPQGSMLASAVINGTGSGALSVGKNIASFTKNATGNYTLTFAGQASTSAIVPNILANAVLTPMITVANASTLSFTLSNASGTLTDASYIAVVVYG